MPTYCYRRGEKVVTRVFSVAERPQSIMIGGKEYVRSFADERPGVPSTKGWPLECVASGVHPSQAGELREFYRKNGCPTEVSEDATLYLYTFPALAFVGVMVTLVSPLLLPATDFTVRVPSV